MEAMRPIVFKVFEMQSYQSPQAVTFIGCLFIYVLLIVYIGLYTIFTSLRVLRTEISVINRPLHLGAIFDYLYFYRSINLVVYL